MNSRGPIRAQQRCGRRGKCAREVDIATRNESGRAGTEDIIEVEEPLARRQRIERRTENPSQVLVSG